MFLIMGGLGLGEGGLEVALNMGFENSGDMT